jgi:hypothetical protein
MGERSDALWRRYDAGRLIDQGRAPIPGSPNRGTLLVKRFAEAIAPTEPVSPAKPVSQAEMAEVIRALQAKVATETLTRAQQAEFVRSNFPGYRVTARQFSEIFRSVTGLKGRPKKSYKKV